MAPGPGRRRVMLLFAVLAGLFLMHGLSAPSMHCMPMSMRMSVPVSMPVSSHMESAMPAAVPSHADAPTSVSEPQQTAAHMQAGESCVPLRPEGMSALFLALFLVVIALWQPGLPPVPRLVHSRWPHGPPRAGVDILHTLSISRT
ncbi:hypothetical protein ABH926_002247 [Catenulispora sp. GP43]|uniref:hypothetical protein n=1 Tax=Catenulispora sp. GP43 TaxID=3156263 RepID=UPI0035174C44